jgi:hypothetical protein
MLTHLPGALPVFFLIEPFEPFECHGFLMTRTKQAGHPNWYFALELHNFLVQVSLLSKRDHDWKRNMIHFVM